jgi:hypothetical protein
MEESNKANSDNTILKTAVNEHKHLLNRLNNAILLEKPVPIAIIITQLMFFDGYFSIVGPLLLLVYSYFSLIDKIIISNQQRKLEEFILRISKPQDDVENYFINWKYHRTEINKSYILGKKLEPIIWILFSSVIAIIKIMSRLL